MNHPKIILDVQAQQWTLNTGKEYWTIPFASDAATLAGFIPLEISDTLQSTRKRHPEGNAHLYSTEGMSCIVELIRKDPDEKTTYIKDYDNYEYVRNITKTQQIEINYCLDIHKNELGSIDFCYGFSPDSDNLGTDAVILLKNIKVLGLRVSVPAETENKPQSVSFQIDGESKKDRALTTGETEEVWINIERPNELGSELRIISYFDESLRREDIESGVSLLELNINFTSWEPFRAIYDKHS